MFAFSLKDILSGLKTSHDTEHDDFTEHHYEHAETNITISVLDELK